MRIAATYPARLPARARSRVGFLSPVTVALLFLFACVPAFAQTVPPEPDPLSRIRAQTPAQACSEAEPTLCAEAAPKIIANATGSASTIEQNLGQAIDETSGLGAGTQTTARLVDWAVSAFRAAGLDVHTESYTLPSGPSGTLADQQNVVAEIRGREKPGEIVILGARLDSWVLTSGGIDDVRDVLDPAVVIEAARDIRATGLVPRRTIRFVLFTGREQGSWAYVRVHRGELDRTRAVIVTAEMGGPITGFSLGGRHDIEPGVREAIKPLESLGTLAVFDDAPPHVESFDFLLEGVPSLVTGQSDSRSTSNDRPASATVDKFDFQELNRSAAIAGVTTFDVAEDVAPLGPRLSRAEIEELLKETGLEHEMKVSGAWEEWESGQRGRQP